MQNEKKNALIWLRNDLRIKDHCGFYNAARNCDKIFAYFSFEPDKFEDTKWGFKKTEKFRTLFLIQTLKCLKDELKKKNVTLIVDINSATVGIPKFIDSLKITDLFYQNEWTKEENDISDSVKKAISKKIKIHTYYDQFLYHPDDISFELDALPEVFTIFRKSCEKNTLVRKVFPEIKTFPSTNLLDDEFIIPKLEHFGFSEFYPPPFSAFPFSGGSKEGYNRINYYLWDTKKISTYKETRNGLVGKDYSSKFSAWLSNGSLSAREIYWQVKDYENKVKKNQSTYWMIFELIWRDYFKYVSLKHGNNIFMLEGILKKRYDWKSNHKILMSWINGDTVEPFVNANMIELKKTGWMSNRGRQNTASFFSKHLFMDWRIGAAYFESQLIDYDVHSNYGNWMYVSGVGNDPRDRKFDISWQSEKYDPKKKFEKLWIK